ARFARLYRTAMAAAMITFCSEDFAKRAIQSINRKHAKVHGVLREAAGSFPAGALYDANDPVLKWWVLATIADSTLLVYDRFISPLTRTQREQYYRESLVATKLLEIPDEIVPPSYADFEIYMRRMLNSGEITVSNQAREIARSLFAPSPGGTALYIGSSIG